MAFREPEAWMEPLGALEQMDVETFVPGHGPLGTKSDLALQKQYLALLPKLVTAAIAEGLSPEQVLEKGLRSPFEAWLHAGMFRWETNVRSMYERLSSKGGG